jgi:type II secretory pathway pseudopilin PulG
MFQAKDRQARSLPAFTFIEILLVVATLVILAAIVVFAINPTKQLAQTRNSQRRLDVKSLVDSINQYELDNGLAPAGIDDALRVIGTATSGCNISCGTKIAMTSESPLVRLADKLSGLFYDNTPSASAASSTGWVLPTGYQDPGNQWSGYANAYDGNSGTYAQNNYGGVGWGQFIILTLDSAVTSDRLRVNADYLDSHVQSVDVDVLKDGIWTDVFEGGSESLWNCKWVELSFAKGSVTQVRFRYNYSTGGYLFWLYELQVYQTADTIVPPSCSIQGATSVQKTAAIMHGLVANDGGEPNQYSFDYGPTTAYGNSTAWTGGAITGDVFSELVSGLTPNTTYHFQAKLRNSAGTTTCIDNTFTTKMADTGWLLPLSSNDPDSRWDNEASAYDDTFSTYARSYHNTNEAQWSSFIYLAHPEIPANSLRFYARGGADVDEIDIDAYKDGVWEDIYQGAFSDKQLVQKDFASGLVSEVRIRFHAANASQGFFYELYEVNLQKSSETSEDACLNLNPALVPKYLVALPRDPSQGSDSKTYYAAKRTSGNRIVIYSCGAELGENISASR